MLLMTSALTFWRMLSFNSSICITHAQRSSFEFVQSSTAIHSFTDYIFSMDPFANNHHHQSFHVMETIFHDNGLPIQQCPPPHPVNGEKKRGGGGEKRGGVKLSTDPQSVAARQRRHRISDRFKMLKSLVPGGSKMDTVSMLEEAINYVKFLKAQIWLHQAALMQHHPPAPPPPPPPPTPAIVPSFSFDEHEYERLVRVSQLVVSAPTSYRTLPIGGGGGGDSGASGSWLLPSDDVDEQMALMEAEHEPRLPEEADLDCLPPFP